MHIRWSNAWTQIRNTRSTRNNISIYLRRVFIVCVCPLLQRISSQMCMGWIFYNDTHKHQQTRIQSYYKPKYLRCILKICFLLATLRYSAFFGPVSCVCLMLFTDIHEHEQIHSPAGLCRPEFQSDTLVTERQGELGGHQFMLPVPCLRGPVFMRIPVLFAVCITKKLKTLEIFQHICRLFPTKGKGGIIGYHINSSYWPRSSVTAG